MFHHDYDPVEDGFAYPLDLITELAERDECSCTVVPPSPGLMPENRFAESKVSLCERCLSLLTT